MEKRTIINIEGNELTQDDLTKEGLMIAHRINELQDQMDELFYQRMKAMRLVYKCDDKRSTNDFIVTTLVKEIKDEIVPNQDNKDVFSVIN
tara:strand:- start:484 stop:756 length:273 start_codon:yes stop_codon:yes gene_type:complete